MRNALRILAVVALGALLAGCETLGYYTQAIGGQFEISTRAQPVDAVMDDPATPAAIRAKLALAKTMREFASRELGLPDNGSYRRYADLGRPFVVWNVVAAGEFSTKAVESCFPVVGCVTYRGYFGEADARAHAEALRAKGYDVQVSGIPAYSTLGWFDDPLLSTFIRYPEAEIARIVFHELAHQVVYIKGDTVFNESFAVAVERAGVRRWLAAEHREGELAAFYAARERQREFVALIEGTKARLDAVYAQPIASEPMRAAKREAFAQFLRDYAALKAGWGGFAGYDRIVGAAPGNALLASITAYSKYVPAFEKMLEAEKGDLPRFYAAVKRLAALPEKERCAALSSAGC
ncbi:MAG: aminopeptidase [Proteobacteria bacterium]|nr:aminopeptidase [Pseudomonadota bacterium]